MNERLYKRKIRLLISIVLVLVMALSGCNGKQKNQERKRENRQESQQEKKETVKADNKDLSKSEQSLQNLQKNLRRSRMPMAAAYLGYADDNSPFRDQVRTLLKNGKYEEQYSFLADVQKENYISYNGEEVYAIVPQSTQYAMKVESFDWDENANAMVRDTLYISQKAAPVILKCNLSELSYNVVITLTKGTETFSYSPSLSLMDGALYAYNLDGMEIYDFTLYDNLEIPVWNEGGECGGCGDPEGYGAPLEAAGEEPGLIGQWISTELKNQSGQNITYGMYFGDYQYFEFQYGQMGHDLECWSGTFEVTDQFRNGELVVHYVLYTPDGIREEVEMQYFHLQMQVQNGFILIKMILRVGQQLRVLWKTGYPFLVKKTSHKSCPFTYIESKR